MVHPEKQAAHEELHPLLQELVDEHRIALEKIDQFEQTIHLVRAKGMDEVRANIINDFFHFFGNNILAHNEWEERTFFPALQQKLTERKELELGGEKRTAVELLQSDHIKGLQLGAVVFNLFGLALRLPDPTSRLLTIDIAAEQAIELVELLKVHFAREENIVYPMAHEYLWKKELDELHTPTRVS